MTCGDGTFGCLGHGDWNNSIRPHLIGECPFLEHRLCLTVYYYWRKMRNFKFTLQIIFNIQQSTNDKETNLYGIRQQHSLFHFFKQEQEDILYFEVHMLGKCVLHDFAALIGLNSHLLQIEIVTKLMILHRSRHQLILYFIKYSPYQKMFIATGGQQQNLSEKFTFYYTGHQ